MALRVLTSTGDAPGTNRFEITGELGKLVCEDEKLTFYKLKENLSQHCASCKGGFDKPEWEVVEVPVDGQNEQHVGVMKAFADAVLHGTALSSEWKGRNPWTGTFQCHSSFQLAWRNGRAAD